MNELTWLRFTAIATDPDAPAQTLTFGLDPGAAAKASINPTNGFFKWRPGELDGPGTYPMTIWVADNGFPSLSATQTFTIAVNEVNSAPSFIDVRDKYVKAGTLLSFMTGVDHDWPPNRLAFTLAPGAPAGTGIDPDSGLFSWTPADLQAPGTYQVTINAVDYGIPPLSTSATYTIHALPSTATLVQSEFGRSDTQMQVSWQSTIGKTYQVYYKDGLDAAIWTPLGPPFVAASSTSIIPDDLVSHTQRFYRILQVD